MYCSRFTFSRGEHTIIVNLEDLEKRLGMGRKLVLVSDNSHDNGRIVITANVPEWWQMSGRRVIRTVHLPLV